MYSSLVILEKVEAYYYQSKYSNKKKPIPNSTKNTTHSTNKSTIQQPKVNKAKAQTIPKRNKNKDKLTTQNQKQ